MKQIITAILFSMVLLCVSCGKKSNDGGNSHVEKGSGKLLLRNATEVLDFRSQLVDASIEERVLMMSNPPSEEYVLLIEDIQRGDYLEITEANVDSWLTSEQKEAIMDNNGCLQVSFFDATYFHAKEGRDAYFSPGSIAFEGSWACE